MPSCFWLNHSAVCGAIIPIWRCLAAGGLKEKPKFWSTAYNQAARCFRYLWSDVRDNKAVSHQSLGWLKWPNDIRNALNRLTQASTSTWGDSYAYDGWGNLLSKTPVSGLTGESLSLTMNTSNQIVPPQGSLLAYDKAGEMTVDNAGNVYTYDAEGRVTQVNDGSYVTTYTYDGNGQRVGKQSTMTSKLYWYGPDGKILNESDGRQRNGPLWLVQRRDGRPVGHKRQRAALSLPRPSGIDAARGYSNRTGARRPRLLSVWHGDSEAVEFGEQLSVHRV